MKKLFLVLLASLSSLFAFGEASCLKNIFPQNYRNLSQLSEEESLKVSQNCSDLISKTVSTAKLGKGFSNSAVFRQNISGRHFYRILVTSVDFEKLEFPTLQSETHSENSFYWLQDSSHAVFQIIIEETSEGYFLIDSDVTGLWKKDNRGTSIYFSDFLISITDDILKTMHLKAEIPVSIGETWDGLIKVTFAPRGTDPYGKQSAECTIVEDGFKSTVAISASDFLADVDAPIKYSLLSAFDHNQSTCYKENSAENIITLQFNYKMNNSWVRKHGKIKITQASIINGDVSSRNAYFSTDRIGTITAEAWENDMESRTKETSSFTLKDYTLENQLIYLPFTEGKSYYIFSTPEIIKAVKHDLSIGEFNMKLAGFGWIF